LGWRDSNRCGEISKDDGFFGHRLSRVPESGLEAYMGAFVSKSDLLSYSYDREGDVLYLTFGEARPAITRGEQNGLLVRTDPTTREVIGVTVLDYETKFRGLDDLSWLDDQDLPTRLVNFLKRRPQVT